MVIETSRLLIRDFIHEDVDDLYEILSDDETMVYVEPVYDFCQTRSFLKEFCIKQKGAVAAVHKENQKVIGYILFKQLKQDIYELGWIFNRTCWQQGYAYEACVEVMEYAFHKLGAQKIVAETADKEKSLKLMKKLGMKQESVQINYAKDTRGNLLDFYTFCLLKEDYK